MVATPIKKHTCPKCGSDDVLVGNSDDPDRCAKCDHKWEHEPAAVITSEAILNIKSPQVLMTINQNMRRKSQFERTLTEALGAIGVGDADGAEEVELDSELNPDWENEEAYFTAGQPASFPATIYYEAPYMKGSRETSTSPGEREGYNIVVVQIVMKDGRDILELTKDRGPEDPLKKNLNMWIGRFEMKMAEKLMDQRITNYNLQGIE